MVLFVNLGIGIAASGISFVLGVMLRTLTDNYRTRRSRAFWGKGIGNGKTIILLGSFSDEMITPATGFEPSGVIGLGDARAAHELAAYFSRLGIAVDIAYTNSPLSGQGKCNIVLIGSEEVNSLVKEVFDDIPTTFRYDTSPPMNIYDSLVSDRLYEPVLSGGQLTVDYGTLIRARNPYAPEHALVIIGGIYGFGTWGGVRLLSDKRFIKRCASRAMKADADDPFGIECLYRVKVHQREPEFVGVLEIRNLNWPDD